MNPVISIVRESWDSYDAHACAAEALFQLGRLWAEHQSPQTGTFPLIWRDSMGGPLAFEDAMQTGEDGLYWDIVAALVDDQGLIATPWSIDDLTALAHAWRQGDAPDGYDANRAMRHIMIATVALARILVMTEEDS